MTMSELSCKILVGWAFLVEIPTLVWLIVAACVAVRSAVGASSLTLMTFGADSVIELPWTILMYWRLRVELRRGEAVSEVVEQCANRNGAVLLATLALYMVISAV
jgi:hypothetical protein